MSGRDRRKYLTATVLDQALLNWCADNLETRLEMVIDIETSDVPIRISDRNKYLVGPGGGIFYEARTKIPVITRTVGDWLVPELQFSTLTLDEISNVDGKYNRYLPGGANYSSWIGKSVTVRLGLGEVESTYFKIFEGKITEVAGMSRTVKSISITARDNFDQLTREFPQEVYSITTFTEMEEGYDGKFVPIIYGDWTINLDPNKAAIPAIAVNGANPYVNGTAGNIEEVGYQDVDLSVTTNPLTFFDVNHVYFKKSDILILVPASEITFVAADKNRFKLRQNNATWNEGEVYKYNSGDTFYVRVKGKDLGIYSDNIVEQARDLLTSYAGLSPASFDANWDSFRVKSSPSQSAIIDFKSRIWEDEPKSTIQYALSLLEQVRLEAFISKEQKLKIQSLHFEDMVVQDFTIKNWDLEQNSFKPYLSERDIFNRARGTFDFQPVTGENVQQTKIYRNNASITQLGNKAISKQITFPNLYEANVVTAQIKEILKLAGAAFEYADLSATWRACLKDVGDIIKLDINIGSTVFSNIPAMIREIGYDPIGLKLPMKLWIFQMCPINADSQIFPGTTGGYNATITEE